MLRLSEEVGRVGRDGIHKVGKLFRRMIVAEQEAAIFLYGRKTEGADTPAQPSLHHEPLIRRQADAGMAAEQVGEARKILRAEGIGRQGHRAAGKWLGRGFFHPTRSRPLVAG